MSLVTPTGTWTRQCQECGQRQQAQQPSQDKSLSDAYRNATCRRCKSSGLDYGRFA